MSGLANNTRNTVEFPHTLGEMYRDEEARELLLQFTHNSPRENAGGQDTLYAKRKFTVEPVFGIITHVMELRQFLLRGLDLVEKE
jgi:hypothetical protein